MTAWGDTMTNQFSPNSKAKSFTKEELIEWMIQEIEENLFIPRDEIELDEPFTSYGIDSAQAVLMVSSLSEKVGIELPPTLFWDYPNIEAVSDYLIQRINEEKSSHSDSSSLNAVSKDDHIAIIGIGCRFPGATNPEEFWNLLKNGVDAITEVPSNRWNIDEYYHQEPGMPGKMVTRWGGFIDQIDQFDNAFFGISRREAERMDPQQRLLLETVVEALEDAGVPLEKIRGTKTGVFIGVSGNEYGKRFIHPHEKLDIYPMTGNSYSIVANRVSYCLHLQGPSIAIDTACSSSLTAVHLAVQSLRNQEADLAIAGGVNLLLDPEVTIAFSKAGMMASDGRCKTFDARANGYVRSEGVGVVLLKPLSQALKDGDFIYAVIRGSAMNQDGRSNGLTAPNGKAQEELLKKAYQNAGINPWDVDYVEAHGTGTPLGDPIEVQALGTVMGKNRSPDKPLKIGSVKTNIGHLEAAAGIAGMIKVALSLKNRQLPPSLHFQSPNPNIPFDQLPIQVQNHLEPWEKEEGTRLAGVSSFGFGGTNVHVVLEEAPVLEKEATHHLTKPWIIPFSARSSQSLTAYLKKVRSWLEEKDVSLADIAYTCSFKRSHHPIRRAVVASDVPELIEQIRKYEEVGREPEKDKKEWLKPVFVFSGQGQQWLGMGLDLMKNEVFRAKMEECDIWVQQYANWSVIEELNKAEHEARLEDTEIAQVLIFALQVSLYELWKSWGIKPAAVVGHSMGEVAAAHVAGIYSLQEAVRIIVHRARVMQPAKGKGKMVAVGLTEDKALEVCEKFSGKVSLAAVNAEDFSVLAGDPSSVNEICETLKEQGIFVREMPGSYAFHSVQMDEYMAPLREALKEVEVQEEQIPFYSTVMGAKVDGKSLDVDYWLHNVRKEVRFYPAIKQLLKDGYRVFIELGPHPVLSSAIRRSMNAQGIIGLTVSSMRNNESSLKHLYHSLAQLYERGYEIDWTGVGNHQGKRISMPFYAWDHQTFWQERLETWAFHQRQSSKAHPLLQRRIPLSAISGIALWETELADTTLSWAKDHRVHGAVIIPASAMVEMALAAAKELNGEKPGSIKEFLVVNPLLLSKEVRKVQITLKENKMGGHSFEITSCLKGEEESDGAWVVHATGKVS